MKINILWFYILCSYFSLIEVRDIMKIVKSLKDAGLLIKNVNETIENELKEQKDVFLGMLLDTLAGTLGTLAS